MVIKISQTGLLKATKPGKVTVTVKVGDYTTSKTYDITVYATISGAATVVSAKHHNILLIQMQRVHLFGA